MRSIILAKCASERGVYVVRYIVQPQWTLVRRTKVARPVKGGQHDITRY
jgi:hypothetical protein